MNWNKLDIICNYPNIPTEVSKPKKFELMKKYARKLSHPFIFVRVDLYEVYDEVRLGELTFSPMNGGMNPMRSSSGWGYLLLLLRIWCTARGWGPPVPSSRTGTT